MAVTIGLLADGLWAVSRSGGDGWAVAGITGLMALLSGAGAWMALRGVPRECQWVAGHGVPIEVVVRGIEHDRQRWHVERLDGAGTVVLEAFRGRSQLVAGDVVHLWLPPGRKDPLVRRVAVTGPFGTLWPLLPDKTRQAMGAR